MAKGIRRRYLAKRIIHWTLVKVDAEHRLEELLKRFDKIIKED